MKLGPKPFSPIRAHRNELRKYNARINILLSHEQLSKEDREKLIEYGRKAEEAARGVKKEAEILLSELHPLEFKDVIPL